MSLSTKTSGNAMSTVTKSSHESQFWGNALMKYLKYRTHSETGQNHVEERVDTTSMEYDSTKYLV